MTNNKQLLIDILLKKAKGFSYKEKTEEFNVVDGKPQLIKRKVTTKKVLPDVNAVKALLSLDEQQTDVCDMTDEQLQVEKLRLIRLLNICDENVSQPVADSSNED